MDDDGKEWVGKGERSQLEEERELQKLQDNVAAGQDPYVSICNECYDALERMKVPPCSLVRVDTGQIPWGSSIPSYPFGNDENYMLRPLTMFEERLLGTKQASRLVTVMRPSSGDSSLKQWQFRGHVFAVQNVSIEDVHEAFPLPFDKIPTHMQVSIILRVHNAIWG